MKICEVVLTELKILDIGHYGGWISPKRKVYYVEEYGHEPFMQEFLNVMPEEEWAEHGMQKPKDIWDIDTYGVAFKINFARFVTKEMPHTFSIEGTTIALHKTYNAWVPTAMQANAIRVDDKTRKMYKTFYMPDGKAKFIQMVSPQSTVAVAEAKLLDTSWYGGWISPDKKVHYVGPFDHSAFAEKYIKKNLTNDEKKLVTQQFKLKNPNWVEPREVLRYLGWVRFQIEDMGNDFQIFSIDADLPALKNTYNVWAPTAMKSDEVYLDDMQYTFPKDKAKFIKKINNG